MNLSGAYVKGIDRTTNGNASGIKITVTSSDQVIFVIASGTSDKYGFGIFRFHGGSVQQIKSFTNNTPNPSYSGNTLYIPVGGWGCGVAISYKNFSINYY